MRLYGKPIGAAFFFFTPFLNHFAMLVGKIFCNLQKFFRTDLFQNDFRVEKSFVKSDILRSCLN